MQATRPLVTFAIKAYRQERVVREAVASAFAQDYDGPMEIILSDDCSPDGTFAVMEEMAAAYRGPHRLRLNRNPRNLGIMPHTNRIWEIAEGRLITGCAGDDIAEPCKVSRLVAAWEAGQDGPRPVTAVHSRVTLIDAGGHEIGARAPLPVTTEDPTPLVLARRQVNGIGATLLYDRGRIMEAFGPLPAVTLIEDGPLFFRAALLGRIAYVDAALVRYRVGGISETRPVSPAWDRLYGDRIRDLRWRIANTKGFLEDLEKVRIPEKAECIAACRAFLARHEIEVALASAGTAGRLALLPRALAASLATRQRRPLVLAAKYLMGPLYLRRLDRKLAQGGA